MGSRSWSGVRVLTALAVLLLAACSSTSGPGERPTSARVRVEGSSPHALKLITSTEFYEDVNPNTGEIFVVLEEADTVDITLPFDDTVTMNTNGNVYVELRNALVPTAAIRLRVDLDNGEGYDQSATLSDNAALIYYFRFTNWS